MSGQKRKIRWKIGGKEELCEKSVWVVENGLTRADELLVSNHSREAKWPLGSRIVALELRQEFPLELHIFCHEDKLCRRDYHNSAEIGFNDAQGRSYMGRGRGTCPPPPPTTHTHKFPVPPASGCPAETCLMWTKWIKEDVCILHGKSKQGAPPPPHWKNAGYATDDASSRWRGFVHSILVSVMSTISRTLWCRGTCKMLHLHCIYGGNQSVSTRTWLWL